MINVNVIITLYYSSKGNKTVVGVKKHNIFFFHSNILLMKDVELLKLKKVSTQEIFNSMV